MRQITLSFRDETIVSLHRDFEAFVRLSLKFDPHFITPSFEDFLRAKLLDNPTPLTEQAVQHMLQNGQYAWAKRALDKEFPDVVEILIRQAAEHGFSFAIRSDWTPEDLINASREWATAIVTEAKGDASQVDVLASQIKAAAMDIREVEEKMQTPAWRLAGLSAHGGQTSARLRSIWSRVAPRPCCTPGKPRQIGPRFSLPFTIEDHR